MKVSRSSPLTTSRMSCVYSSIAATACPRRSCPSLADAAEVSGLAANGGLLSSRPMPSAFQMAPFTGRSRKWPTPSTMAFSSHCWERSLTRPAILANPAPFALWTAARKSPSALSASITIQRDAPGAHVCAASSTEGTTLMLDSCSPSASISAGHRFASCVTTISVTWRPPSGRLECRP